MLFPSVKLPLRLFFLLSLAFPIFAQNHSDSSLLITLARLNLTQLNLLPGSGSGGKAMLFSGGGAGEDGGGNDWGGGGSSSPAQWIIQWPETPESVRKNEAGRGSVSSDTTGPQTPDSVKSKESWMYSDSDADNVFDSASSGPPGGGEHNRFFGEKNFSEGSFTAMLEALDGLMAQLPDGVRITLLSDYDDTQMPDRLTETGLEASFRKSFRDFVTRWRDQKKLNLIVISHNAEVAAGEVYEKHNLPIPDFVISGCTLHRVFQIQRLAADSFYSEIMPVQPGCEQIKVTQSGVVVQRFFSLINSLKEVVNLVQQIAGSVNSSEEHDTHEQKLSFKIDQPLSETQQGSIKRGIFNHYGVLARVSFFEDRLEVALPVSKGALISRFVTSMGLSGSHVIAVGDSESDTSMMESLAFSPDFKVSGGVIVRGSLEAFSGLANYQGKALFVPAPLISGIVQGMIDCLGDEQDGALTLKKQWQTLE